MRRAKERLVAGTYVSGMRFVAIMRVEQLPGWLALRPTLLPHIRPVALYCASAREAALVARFRPRAMRSGRRFEF